MRSAFVDDVALLFADAPLERRHRRDLGAVGWDGATAPCDRERLRAEAHAQPPAREQVAQSIGKLARPATVIFATDLPKTRSGKIMRRLLKNLAEGEELGDTSTLVDPSVVDEMQKQMQK